MKVSVDGGLCEAHGQCCVVDFELFPLDEDGYSAVGTDRPVPDGEEGTARIGVDSCPVRALSLHE